MKNYVPFLIEFRKRVLLSLVVIACVFIIFCIYAKPLYHLLALPLLNHLLGTSQLIATSLITPFLVPIKFAFVLSVFVTAPFWLYQIGRFIAPALYQRERRLMWLFLLSASILFYLGLLFAYYIILPSITRLLIAYAPSFVAVNPDIQHYLDFSLSLLFAFGVTFEVPLITCLVVIFGIFTVEQLASARPYVILIAFILGMLLTPPDVISQICLALPMWLLFEVGLLAAKICRLNLRKKEQAV